MRILILIIVNCIYLFSILQLLKEGEITPGITGDEYISRRKKLLQLLPEKSLAIIASAPVKMMTDVVPYTFRQDADYLFLTGCSQPGSIAVLSEECGLCMFMPDPDPHVRLQLWLSMLFFVRANRLQLYQTWHDYLVCDLGHRLGRSSC